MRQVLLILAIFVAGVVAKGAVQLTDDTFDEKVAGKAAFIKFLADWNKLGDAFASSKTVLIGDVDCTVHEETCQRFGVEGYPTLKYFTGATGPDGEDYDGERDYDSLKAWADENLGPSCGPSNKDLCKPEQLKEIEDAEKLSDEDIEKKISEATKVQEDAEELFKTELEKLQEAYEQLQRDKEKTIKSVGPSLRLHRSIAAHRLAQKEAKKEKTEEKEEKEEKKEEKTEEKKEEKKKEDL